jgi:hypothetical protein
MKPASATVHPSPSRHETPVSDPRVEPHRDTPNWAATRVFGVPSAHANTIRARIANACDDVARRVHRTNVCRSSSDSTNNPCAFPGIHQV